MRALLIAALLGTSVNILSASDWPQFRGPGGSGVYADGSLPSDLTKDAAAWVTPVPFGRSSPVVVSDRLYLTAAEGDNRLTVAYRTSDGRELWRHAIKAARAEELLERLNDPASPTPVADRAGVVAFFPDAGLVAVDTSGRERWRLPLGPFLTAYGMASSPILFEDLVIQTCDQQRGSFLIAVNRRDGRVRWRVERPEMREGWYTPTIVRGRGTEPSAILVVPGSARIQALDPRTGREVWSALGSGAENLGVPVVDAERIYVTIRGFATPAFESWESLVSRHDENKDMRIEREEVKTRRTYHEQFNYVDVNRDGFFSEAEWNAMRNAGVGNFGLTALRRPVSGTPEVAWRFEKNLPYVPAPLLYDGIIYMVKSGGILTAVDSATGALLKESRAGDALGEYFASPVAGDHKVYVANAEGKVTVLEAGRDLKVLSVSDLGEEVYATPALASGAVILRARAHLYSFRNSAHRRFSAGEWP